MSMSMPSPWAFEMLNQREMKMVVGVQSQATAILSRAYQREPVGHVIVARTSA